MSARLPGPYDDVARKWLALAERRKAHFIELRDSGRWRHYYTQPELFDTIREAGEICDEWARIAGLRQAEGEASA